MQTVEQVIATELFGEGIITRSIYDEENAVVLNAAVKAGLIPNDSVSLRSNSYDSFNLTETPEYNPIIEPLLSDDEKEISYLRQGVSYRSKAKSLVNRVVEVVKGADFLKWMDMPVRVSSYRIKKNEIAGGMMVNEAELEFDNMMKLHKVSLEKRGRLAPLPVPIKVVSVNEIEGEDVYVHLNKTQAKGLIPNIFLKVHGIGAKLGDIYRDKSLRPAILVYNQEGTDLRVLNALSYLFLKTRGVYEKTLNDKTIDGKSIFGSSDVTKITFQAQNLVNEYGISIDQAIRLTYGHIFEAYGLDSEVLGFLPDYEITSDNYEVAMQYISKNIAEGSIGKKAIIDFSNNCLDLITLAHGSKMILDYGSGGPQVERNITVRGIGKDAGSIGDISQEFDKVLAIVSDLVGDNPRRKQEEITEAEQEEYQKVAVSVAQDIREMLTTIMSFSRVLGVKSMDLEGLKRVYTTKLAQVTKDAHLVGFLDTVFDEVVNHEVVKERLNGIYRFNAQEA